MELIKIHMASGYKALFGLNCNLYLEVLGRRFSVQVQKSVGSCAYCGSLWVNPSSQQRGLPAVHLILSVAGQLQMPVVLIHVPKAKIIGL